LKEFAARKATSAEQLMREDQAGNTTRQAPICAPQRCATFHDPGAAAVTGARRLRLLLDDENPVAVQPDAFTARRDESAHCQYSLGKQLATPRLRGHDLHQHYDMVEVLA
jgi:hypothetical protein